ARVARPPARFSQPRLDRPGCHRVDRDPVSAEIHCEGAGEPEYPGLRGAVRGHRFESQNGRVGADVDDPAATPLPHDRGCGPTAFVDPAEVDADRSLPIVTTLD